MAQGISPQDLADLLSYLPSLTVPASNAQLAPHLSLGLASPTPLIAHLETATNSLIPFVRRGPEGETEAGKQWNWKVLMGWWVWENEFGLGSMGRVVEEQEKGKLQEVRMEGREEEELEFLRSVDQKVAELERRVQGAREWLASTTAPSSSSSSSSPPSQDTALESAQSQGQNALPGRSSPIPQTSDERKANASNASSLTETEGGNDAAYTDELGNPRDVWPIPEDSDEDELEERGRSQSGRGSPARWFSVDVGGYRDNTSEEEEGEETPQERREGTPRQSVRRAQEEGKREKAEGQSQESEGSQQQEEEGGDPESSLGGRYVTLRRGNSHDGQQGDFRIGRPSYLNGEHGSSPTVQQQHGERQGDEEEEHGHQEQDEQEDAPLPEQRHSSDPVNADELYNRLDAYASRTPESTGAFMASRVYESSPSVTPARLASVSEHGSNAETTRPISQPQQNRSNRNSVHYTREDLDDSYSEEDDEQHDGHHEEYHEEHHDEHDGDYYEGYHEEYHEDHDEEEQEDYHEEHPEEHPSQAANTTLKSPARAATCETVPDSEFDLRNFQSSLIVSNSVLFGAPMASSTPAKPEIRRSPIPPSTPGRPVPKQAEENSSPAGGVSVRIENAEPSWQPSSPPFIRKAQEEESCQLPCSPMVRRPRMIREESLWEEKSPGASWTREEQEAGQSSSPPVARHATVEEGKSSSSPVRGQSQQQPTPGRSSPAPQQRLQASSSPKHLHSQQSSSSPTPLPHSEVRSPSNTPSKSKIPVPRYTSHAAGNSSIVNIALKTPLDSHHLTIHTPSPLVPREAWATNEEFSSAIPSIQVAHPSDDGDDYDHHHDHHRPSSSADESAGEEVGDDTDIWINPTPVQGRAPAVVAPVPSTPVTRVPSVPASIARFLPKQSSPLKDYVYKPSSSDDPSSSSRMDLRSDQSEQQQERREVDTRYDFDESHHSDHRSEYHEEHDEQHDEHGQEGGEDGKEQARNDGVRPAYDFSSSTTERTVDRSAVTLDPPLEALIERLDFSDDDHEGVQERRGSSPVVISRELEEKLEVLDFTDEEAERSHHSVSPYSEHGQRERQQTLSPHSERENQSQRSSRQHSRHHSISPHVEQEEDMQRLSSFVEGDTAELERSLERSLGLVAASIKSDGEREREWQHDVSKVSEGVEEEEEEGDYEHVQKEDARSRCISRRSMRHEEHSDDEEVHELQWRQDEEQRQQEERVAYSFDEDEHNEHEDYAEHHSSQFDQPRPTDEHSLVLQESEHTKEPRFHHDEHSEDEGRDGNEEHSGDNSGSLPNQTNGVTDLFQTAIEYDDSRSEPDAAHDAEHTALPPSGSSSPISRVQTIHSSSSSEDGFSTPAVHRSPAKPNSARIPNSNPPVPAGRDVRNNLFPRASSSSPAPRHRQSSPSALPHLPNSSPDLRQPQTPGTPRLSSPSRLEHPSAFQTPRKTPSSERDDRTIGFPTPIPKLEYTPRQHQSSSSSVLLFPQGSSTQRSSEKDSKKEVTFDHEEDDTIASLDLDLSGPIAQSSPHRRDHSLNLEDATMAFDEEEEMSEVDVDDLSFSSPRPRNARFRRDRVRREMRYVAERNESDGDTGEVWGSGDTGVIGGFTGRLSGGMVGGGLSSSRR